MIILEDFKMALGINMPLGTSSGVTGLNDLLQRYNLGNNLDVGGMDSGGFEFGLNEDTFGALSSGANALGNLFNIYAGIKGLNQARDSFNFNRDLARTNLANQANLTNEQLSTRQGSRLRSQGLSPEEVQAGVAEFMQKYGVKGSIGG